jgi:endonuclease YncB( thermonuclease family)
MTTFLLALALLLFPHLVASPALEEPPKKCTGQTPCPACSTCSRCRHCKVEGGTCGAYQHPDNMVVRVIDGDTIVVQVNGHPETVRLIGVDTPETKDPRKPVEYFGKEASRFTATLVKGQQVRLEIQTNPTSRDRYGRLLAYVFRRSDNLLVNK